MKRGEKEYVVLQISKWIFNSISRVFKEEKKKMKSEVFRANTGRAMSLVQTETMQ